MLQWCHDYVVLLRCDLYLTKLHYQSVFLLMLIVAMGGLLKYWRIGMYSRRCMVMARIPAGKLLIIYMRDPDYMSDPACDL